MLLVVLAAVGFSTLFAAPPSGSISGVIIDAATGVVLPGTKLILPNGTSTTTNIAGIFTFPALNPGNYQLQISAAGYLSQSRAVERRKDDDVMLSIALEPIIVAGAEPIKEPAPEETKGKVAAAKNGVVKLNIEFDDYILYFDDKIVGKNIKKISRIKPGKHNLTIEKDQYEEYRTEVSVKARRTTEIAITLADLKPKTTPQQRARNHFALGKDALDDGLYQRAIEHFDTALTEVAEFADALQYRGWAFRKLGNMSQATADLVKAAKLFTLANRYLEAIPCVDVLIQMHPKDGNYYVQRGDIRTALGEAGSAIDDYRAAVKIDKGSLIFRLSLAEGYYRMAKYKEAAKSFEKARKMTNNSQDIYVRLILAYMYAGKDNDMIKRYRELAEFAPPDELERLARDPEWQEVLQLVGPNK